MSASGPPAESPSPEVVASISGGGGASSSSSSGAAPASAAGEPVAPQLPAGISSLTDYIGKPEAEAVAALKAANPDFEVTACHFAKLSGIRHGPGSERILRVVYNTDKSVREIKRK